MVCMMFASSHVNDSDCGTDVLQFKYKRIVWYYCDVMVFLELTPYSWNWFPDVNADWLRWYYQIEDKQSVYYHSVESETATEASRTTPRTKL